MRKDTELIDPYIASSILDLIHTFYGKYHGLCAEFRRQAVLLQDALDSPESLDAAQRENAEHALKWIEQDAEAAHGMLRQFTRFRDNKPTDERLREWLVVRLTDTFDWRMAGEVLY